MRFFLYRVYIAFTCFDTWKIDTGKGKIFLWKIIVEIDVVTARRANIYKARLNGCTFARVINTIFFGGEGGAQKLINALRPSRGGIFNLETGIFREG